MKSGSLKLKIGLKQVKQRRGQFVPPQGLELLFMNSHVYVYIYIYIYAYYTIYIYIASDFQSLAS